MAIRDKEAINRIVRVRSISGKSQPPDPDNPEASKKNQKQ
jgi:hypothetical protein